jgi:hypothetical protein
MGKDNSRLKLLSGHTVNFIIVKYFPAFTYVCTFHNHSFFYMTNDGTDKRIIFEKRP